MKKNIAYLKDVKILFLVYIINISACIFFIYNRIHGINESQRWVNRTIRTQLYLEQSLSYLKDAESAQRGFLLTQDSAFLQPYYGAFENTNQAIHYVDSLTKDNPRQQKNLLWLQGLVNGRFLLFNQIFQSSDFFNKTPDEKRQQLLKGKTEMDSVRNCIAKMLTEENARLKERQDKKNRYIQVTLNYSLALMVFSVAIITFCYFWLVRELNKNMSGTGEQNSYKNPRHS
ncbi:MAG: CHASE3 domain-containing protein [Bacteroidetes bacterium]|nr:CHASE3 domain-containing protein [Bacteroidota bacterium]